ncbi:hypothetical protein [Sphingomonas sanguinis]|uniref:hypothetical protein n=1 Tax=Sphingomonas sanguinis TaxID=33051 RepID=UPI0012E7207A|nr:hypothetical protein [Sphingomonas sanguinis]
MTRIYVRWSVDGQFIRKWSREPFVDGDPVDAIGRVATDGEALSWRLDRIIEDGGPLTLSDKAVLREAAALLSNRAAPPAMDREAVDAEVERITAMSDGEIMAEADASEVAWARAFNQGLRAGQHASTVGALVKALEWYRDQVSRVRMVHKEGDEARNALDADCGKLATDALSTLSAVAHSDDIAVDRFAALMKAKLASARAKGRGGWDDPSQCSTDYLRTLLHEHIAKGDPVDVANFCMMLAHYGASTTLSADAIRQGEGLDHKVAAFVADYEFRGDDGDFTPNDWTKAIIEDAIHGFLALATPATPASDGGKA